MKCGDLFWQFQQQQQINSLNEAWPSISRYTKKNPKNTVRSFETDFFLLTYRATKMSYLSWKLYISCSLGRED